MSKIDPSVVPARPVGSEGSDVLTVPELARLLRIGRNSAYEAIQRGEIPGVIRVGRSIRVSRATVVRWISQGASSERTENHR